MKNHRQISKALEAQRPTPRKTIADLIKSPVGEALVTLLLIISDLSAYYTVLNIILLEQPEWMVMLVTLAASALTLVQGLHLGGIIASRIPEHAKGKLWVIETILVVAVMALLVIANGVVRAASMNGTIADPTAIDSNAETFFMIVLIVASFATAVVIAAGHPAPTNEDALLIAEAQLDALRLAREQLACVVDNKERMAKVDKLDRAKCDHAKAEVDAVIASKKETARLEILRLCGSDHPEVIFNAEFLEERS